MISWTLRLRTQTYYNHMLGNIRQKMSRIYSKLLFYWFDFKEKVFCIEVVLQRNYRLIRLRKKHCNIVWCYYILRALIKRCLKYYKYLYIIPNDLPSNGSIKPYHIYHIILVFYNILNKGLILNIETWKYSRRSSVFNARLDNWYSKTEH